MKSLSKHPIAFVLCLLAAGILSLAGAGRANAAQPAANVPAIAGRLAAELDSQVARLLGQTDAGCRNLRIIVTTPADLNNLEDANSLSRQMSEELAYWLVHAGYQVQELRRGAALLFNPDQGEFLLTRKRALLAAGEASAGAVLTGTYTVTPRAVRFNIRLLELATGETLAMSNATIPMTGEVRALVADNAGNAFGISNAGMRPSSGTSLSTGIRGETVSDADRTDSASPEPVPPSPFTTRAY